MDTTYKQVTVDVPEERLPEFHAFFARFLAGATRGRRGRHGRPHRGHHGHGCAQRRHGYEAGPEGIEVPGQTPGPESPATGSPTEV